MDVNANYFFLHIPKCGGVSLSRLLAQDPYYYPVFAHRQIGLRAERFYRSYRGVGGHWPLRSAYRLGFKNAWKFTFLREPVDRLVSHLVYAAMRESPPPDWDVLRHDLEGIKTHLQQDLGSAMPTYSHCLRNYISTTIDDRAPDDEQVQSAVANLQGFEFIGHQESFNSDVAALLQLLGLSLPEQIPHENVSRTKPRATALRNELLSDVGCRDLLWECTALDRRIYEKVRAWQQATPKGPLTPPLAGCCPPPAVDLTPLELRVVETLIENEPDILPGSPLGFNILLEVFVPELACDLELTLEISPDGESAVQVFTFNELKRHLALVRGLSLVRLQMPCWLNKGYYVGHVRIFSLHREVIAEKVNAFQLTIYYFASPAQFGAVYANVNITVEDVSFRRRWPLEEAKKLRLSLDPELPIKVTNEISTIPLVLENRARSVLSSRADCCYYVSFHFADESGSPIVFDGHRFPIPLTPPGRVSRFAIDLGVTDSRVRQVQLRLLQENVRWHEGADFPHQAYLNLSISAQGIVRSIIHSPRSH